MARKQFYSDPVMVADPVMVDTHLSIDTTPTRLSFLRFLFSGANPAIGGDAKSCRVRQPTNVDCVGTLRFARPTKLQLVEHLEPDFRNKLALD